MLRHLQRTPSLLLLTSLVVTTCCALACGSSDDSSSSSSAPEHVLEGTPFTNEGNGNGSSTATTAGAQLPSDQAGRGSASAHDKANYEVAVGAPPAAPSPPTAPTGTTPPGSTTPPPATPPPPSATPPPPPATPPPPPATPPPVAVPFRGVNLAGGEFGSAIPGKDGTDYKWPTPAEVDYYIAKGMNTFRVGFKWERLQPTKNGPLEPAYLASLHSVVTYATGKGAKVILNPHNFARYYGELVGSTQVPASAFADFWSRLATKYASNPRVMFNLVNEPHDMPTEQWVTSANAAIASIRSAGAGNMIIAPGNAWTGAHSWAATYYGTPNAVAMLDIVDPSNNTIFEVHQYLDTNSGGQSDTCVSTTIGSQRLAPFINWLRTHGKKGFVGEFAGGNNTTCNAAVQDMLQTMMSASDVLVGWVWWAAGPWWSPGYPFTLEPKNGQDAPQMALLTPHLQGLPL